ncbi:MAG: peptide chain release factor N(5)-glutamine methyltransferase [Myxococcota bacterium]
MTENQKTWTVKEVLRWTTAKFKEVNIDTPRLDAELLIAKVIGRDRVGVYLDYNRPLIPEERKKLRVMVRKRLNRVPVAYILGKKEFYGLEFKVSPAVLVPRPDTEILVETALQILETGDSVLDLGTGSGAIITAVGCNFSGLQLEASDISPEALAIAQQNTKAQGLEVDFYLGDMFHPLVGKKFNLIISNPPYIPPDTALQPELKHEPQSALITGDKGLKYLKIIIEQAPAHLHPEGKLLLEFGENQEKFVFEQLKKRGYVNMKTVEDLAGLPRMAQAQYDG